MQQGFIEPESERDSKACWDSNVASEWMRTRRNGGAITDNGLFVVRFYSERKKKCKRLALGGGRRGGAAAAVWVIC